MKDQPATDWLSAPAYVWTGSGARPVGRLAAPRLELLRGIDRQKAAAAENVLRHARGHAAHDMLLWGAGGMGKSALVRSAALAAQEAEPGRLALVQVATDAVGSLSALFASLGAVERRFVVFIDDLAQQLHSDLEAYAAIGRKHMAARPDDQAIRRDLKTRFAERLNTHGLAMDDAALEQALPGEPARPSAAARRCRPLRGRG